ncbi:MAG: hypothetical protein ACF8PN_12785 [Phycisphaerales bacterium]
MRANLLHRFAVTASVTLMLTFLPTAVAQDDEEMEMEHEETPWITKIYDLRDVAALLPPSEEHDDLLDFITQEIVASQGFPADRLAAGVYMVSGEPENHDTFVELIGQVESLYHETYEVELLMFTVPSGEAPELRSRFDGDAELRTKFVVQRRHPTLIEATEVQTYVSDWQPVVGDQSAGYDPETSEIESGLVVTVTVGTGLDGDGIGFLMRGEVSDVTMHTARTPGSQYNISGLDLGLPTLARRSIRSNLRIAEGESTVVAVTPGFHEGAIVIAARVTAIDE